MLWKSCMDTAHNKINFIKTKFIIHATNTLPQMGDNVFEYRDNTNGFRNRLIKIFRYELKRLPKPYDTRCHEYSANKSQFHCINNCYLNKYLDKFRCIPKYNSLLTIQLSNNLIEPNVTFCPDYYINNDNNFNSEL